MCCLFLLIFFIDFAFILSKLKAHSASRWKSENLILYTQFDRLARSELMNAYGLRQLWRGHLATLVGLRLRPERHLRL